MSQVDFVSWRLSRTIRSAYPQPIAYRFVSLANEINTKTPDWFKAINLMINLCEIVVQYGSAIAVQSYIQAYDIESEEVTLKIESLEEKPFSTEDWCELLRETLRCFIGNEDKLFIPELLNFYWQSPKESMTRTAVFLNEISGLQNKAMGHVWMREDIDKVVIKNLPKVGRMLSELDFLREYLLFAPTKRRENSYDGALFEGDGNPVSEVIETQVQLNIKDAYIISAEKFDAGSFDEVLCLSPLIVYEKCPDCPRQEEQIFLFQSYEEDKKNPMEYVAPLCEHQIDTDTYVEKFKQLLCIMREPTRVSARPLSYSSSGRLGKRFDETSEQEDSVRATPQIFLSYAREDREKVKVLYKQLSDAGFKPWMDTKDIFPGENWQRAIRIAIRNSDFFLACLSANSVDKRGPLQVEIEYALNIRLEKLKSDIYLIPARLEDCDMPEELCDFQRVDLFEDDGWTQLVKAIQVGLERRRRK